MNQMASSSLDQNRLDKALEMLTILSNLSFEVRDFELQYLDLIFESFQCDGIVSILTDHENPEKYTKHSTKNDRKWQIQKNIEFTTGVLRDCVNSKKLMRVDSVSTVEYSPADLIEGITPESMVICPVTSNMIQFGCVGIVNPIQQTFSELDKVLLELLCSKMAGNLYYNLALQKTHAKEVELAASNLQLTKSRNVLRTLFDNLPDGLYIVDRDYRIIAINETRARQSGSVPREFVGRICFNSLFNSVGPCEECLIQKSMSTANSTKRYLTRSRSENDLRNYEVNTFPIVEKDGQSFQVIVHEQDITEKKRMEAELIQSEKLVAVGQLASGIVHEINNPLTTVLANAQMLLQDIPEDNLDWKQSILLIEKATKRADQVVRNMLSIVRNDTYEIEPVDLNESIQNALQLVSHDFLSKKVSILFDRGDPMPLLPANSNQLQGAWVNLLLNSIEAINSDHGEIKITTLYDEGNFYVEVRDNGVGISENNLDKIFEPFFSTKSKQQVTGLGLSLVKKVIERHGGKILVESSEGEGARFVVILPEKNSSEMENENQKYEGFD